MSKTHSCATLISKLTPAEIRMFSLKKRMHKLLQIQAMQAPVTLTYPKAAGDSLVSLHKLE